MSSKVGRYRLVPIMPLLPGISSVQIPAVGNIRFQAERPGSRRARNAPPPSSAPSSLPPPFIAYSNKNIRVPFPSARLKTVQCRTGGGWGVLTWSREGKSAAVENRSVPCLSRSSILPRATLERQNESG
ncbi:hypothetical protein LY76DRAFT_192409 [Colletotrichum caudatum]|nr:hypothetical protein LY76DRAFT_192409 [Colletotrichum caudatum]